MTRDPLDRYYTPPALATACLRALGIEIAAPVTLLEPCAGDGVFGVSAASRFGVQHLLGCDIDPDCNAPFLVDFVPVDMWTPRIEHPGDVWIVTNPHYAGIYDTVSCLRDLQAFVEASVLGLLLRATAIEQLMCSHDPPHELHISSLRPRWGGIGGAALKSGDTCGSVFAVWRAGYAGPTVARALPPWRKKGR